MWQRASDKRWCERVKINGKKKLITAKTKAELNAKLKDAATFAEKGRRFEESAELWEEAHENVVEFSTWQSYKPHVKRVREHFQGRYIKDITADEISAYIDSLAKARYAKGTVHRALNVLNMIFNYEIARPDTVLRFNPCSAIKTPKNLPKKFREPPTEEQLIKVTPDSDMGLFAYFLQFTGLRRGEMLALQWSDIDLENHVIHVRKTVAFMNNQPSVKERAKTEAGVRDVALVDVLETVLKNKMLQSQKGYVFGSEKPLTATQFRKRWLQWCRQVGLAEAETTTHKSKNGHTYTRTKWHAAVTPHQFRHEYASMLEDAKISEFDAKTQLGHSSITVTKDVYTHIRKNKASKITDQLNEYIKNKNQVKDK